MSFELEVWGGGYPVCIILRHRGKELRFSHKELLELEQAVQRAKREVLCNLPKDYWHELAAEFAVGRE